MTSNLPSDEQPLSRLHPATLLIEIPSSLRGFIVPLGIVLVFSGSWDRVGQSFGYAIWFILIPILVTVFRYFTLRFGVRGDRLLVQSGLLNRTQRTIPLDQIQNVDVRRGVVHRWFKVCDVRIETAGGSGAEAHFSVVSEGVAARLREDLLRKRDAPATQAGEATAPAAPTETVIRAARLRDLLVAGATETRVGAFLAFLVAIGDNLREGGFDISDWLDTRFQALLGDGPLATSLVFAALTLMFLVVGWTASIVLTVVRWYGFRLFVTEHGLRRRFGLFTQFESLVRRERIQLVLLESNPIRRALSYTTMRVQTAGSPMDAEASGSTLLAPMLPFAAVDGVLRHVFDGVSFCDADLQHVHRKALRRGFVRATLVLAAFVVAPVAWNAPWFVTLAVGIIAVGYAAWFARARYRALGYALGERFLVARAGVWTRRWWIVPKDRVQTLALEQSPMQRMSGLATLVVDTAGAAGHSVARVVDLDVNRARELFDDLLAHASQSPWGGGLARDAVPRRVADAPSFSSGRPSGSPNTSRT